VSPFGFGLGAGVCARAEWNGTSHIPSGDGSAIDTTWTFELESDGAESRQYIVKAAVPCHGHARRRHREG